MALKGSFKWINSLQKGGRKSISFTLLCDNLFQSETFDCAIVDSSGQMPPQIRRQITLKAKQSFKFDYDSCGWDWCIGDYFALLGKNDKILKRWDLNVKVYKRGECPDCHGTQRCKECNGNGIHYHKHICSYSQCLACNGTGICQTCYVPIRHSKSANQVIPVQPSSHSRQCKINAIREEILDLQSKIEQAEWNRRMMQMRDTDISSHSVYSSQLSLIHQYKIKLINLQSELQQLESMIII